MDLSAGPDRAALARLVREAFGDRATVASVRQIRPWTVARCQVDGVGRTTSVIAKWLRSNTEGFRVERRQIATEAAALGLVGEVAPGIAPALLGHDLDHDLFLVEDLAPRRTLHSMLARGLSPTGVAGLHAYAAAMGRLHAATTRADRDGPWDREAQLPIDRPAAASLLDRLSEIVGASSTVRGDLDAAIETISRPGPFGAFSNGDSGANNCLVDADGGDARLIDFEHACRRHALLDAVALHVPGSMWMTVADPLPLGIEQTYRQVAGDGMEAVLDDELYGDALSSACALRATSKLLRFDKLDVREPGHHSRPQLVTTIERAVETMDRWDRHGALKTWLGDVAAALRVRWPDADVQFPDDYTLREPFDPDH